MRMATTAASAGPARYRISGAGITTTTINLTDAGNTNFNATFTQANNSAGNYVKFSITASGLHADGDAGFGRRTGPGGRPSTAMQIVRQ